MITKCISIYCVIRTCLILFMNLSCKLLLIVKYRFAATRYIKPIPHKVPLLIQFKISYIVKLCNDTNSLIPQEKYDHIYGKWFIVSMEPTNYS